jgi:hypothetical protein
LPPDPSRAQLCQVLFNFDESSGDPLTLPGVTVAAFPMPIPKMPYDVLIYAGVDRAGLSSQFNYDTALFSEDSVAEKVHEFERILRVAVDDPTVRMPGPGRNAG